MTRTVLTATAAACLLAAAVPAPASAASAFRGKTSQGRLASVVTAADGTPKRVRIGWKAPCATGATYSTITRFVAPFDMAQPGKFSDGGSFRARIPGYSVRFTAFAAGSLQPGGTWAGTFRVKAVVSRKGKRVDTCRLKRVSWSALPLG
jgi:pyruvate carboxylase